MQRKWFALLAITLGLLICGCPWSTAKKVAPEPQYIAAAVGFKEGQTAPDMEVEDMTGERFHIADYKGKVVAMHFWANW